MRYVKNPATFMAREAAGEAIIRLSQTAFKTGIPPAKTEWEVFDADPGDWLFKLGYRYVGAGAPANGAIPANMLTIVPVYDTPNVMHVRVPWIGNIDRTVVPPDGEDEYGNSITAFLGSYFTRHCR